MTNLHHKAYSYLVPLWAKVRDVVAGEEVVKAKTSEYLPQLASQAEADTQWALESYHNYVLRAGFYGAAGRTVQGLVGAITRKDPAIEGVPEEHLKDIQDSIGLDYEPLDSLASSCLRELTSVGRVALLVDKGDDPDSKPYVVRFKAEDVLYWDKTTIAGRETPSLIILRQMYQQPDPADVIGTKSEDKEEFLVLRLAVLENGVPAHIAGGEWEQAFVGAPTGEPVYWQEVWREGELGLKGQRMSGSDSMELFDVRVPTKNGGRFWSEIPCDIINAVGGIRIEIEEPPLLPLVNVILSHYRGSADLEWGRHLCAIPQPVVSGFQLEDDARLVMGCGYAWSSADPNAKAYYLEFSGAGLGHIADGLKEKEKQMAVLGARMLEEQPAAAEAMGTVRLRQSGDRSVLATIGHHCSVGITRAIQRYLSWESPTFETPEAQADVAYKLATDFDSTRMEAAELTTFVQSLQQGAISWETFAHNLRKGELLPPGVTDDEERERIEMGAPGRNRDGELTMLQTDVREGRISSDTYLEQIQTKGLLAGVDIAAEKDKVFEDKVASAEIQMLSFTQAGNNLGGPFESGPPSSTGPTPPQFGTEDESSQDDVEEDEEEEDVQDEEEGSD